MSGPPERPLVRIAVDDGVGVLRLDDPEHRNALSKRMSDEPAARRNGDRPLRRVMDTLVFKL